MDPFGRAHGDWAVLVDLYDETWQPEQAAWKRVASDDDRVRL